MNSTCSLFFFWPLVMAEGPLHFSVVLSIVSISIVLLLVGFVAILILSLIGATGVYRDIVSRRVCCWRFAYHLCVCLFRFLWFVLQTFVMMSPLLLTTLLWFVYALATPTTTWRFFFCCLGSFLEDAKILHQGLCPAS